MKRIITILAMLSLLMCAAMSASAADIDVAKKSNLERIISSGELRVGMEAGYMPFEMTDKKGKIVGFDVDIAKKMAKAMGVKLKIVNTAWDGIIPALLSDKFDVIMSGMTITQERNLKINFADSYISAGQTVLVAKKFAGEINSYKDLNNPKYIVTSKLGTTGEKAVKRMLPKATYKSFETETEAMLEVMNGKAAASVYDLPMCIVFFAQRGQEAGMKFLNKPFTTEPFGWAVKKGDPDFLNWLDNFLYQIKADGSYDKLYNKWFGNTDWLNDVQ
ncbi:MAG: transporter substrate-binding domain-containing protein [Pseudodesulfovibrio sp.]